jgi:hypothetical protein
MKLNQELNQELNKRFKTFLWSLGWMIIAACIDFALQNLGLLSKPGEVTIILGLVLTQVSKFVKNKKDGFKG